MVITLPLSNYGHCWYFNAFINFPEKEYIPSTLAPPDIIQKSAEVNSEIYIKASQLLLSSSRRTIWNKLTVTVSSYQETGKVISILTEMQYPNACFLLLWLHYVFFYSPLQSTGTEARNVTL